MDAKIQVLLEDDSLKYISLKEFITLVSNQVKKSNSFKVSSSIGAEDVYLSVSELEAFLKVSRPTIRKWTKLKILSPTIVGGKIYYSKKKVIKLLENKKA